MTPLARKTLVALDLVIHSTQSATVVADETLKVRPDDEEAMIEQARAREANRIALAAWYDETRKILFPERGTVPS